MADERYAQAITNVARLWSVTVPALFLVLAVLGLTMRLNHAAVLDLDPGFFYATMTLHGLGMAGTAFVGGYAGAVYLLARYVRPDTTIAWSVYAFTVLGVVGLIVATLIGGFGPGWYVLYPLPFQPNGAWPEWATGLAVVSLIVLGAIWLIGQLDLFRAIVARYGLFGALGWGYLRKDHKPADDLPPLVLILAAGCLIPGILTTIDGAVLLMLYLFKWFSPALALDPLLLKNMVFLWGHTLVNITMYLGLALIYEIFPKYSGRPWKTNRVVAIAWNAVLVFVLFAFLHHMYMDFVQPTSLQYLGQIASYLSAVPATVVTVFGVITQVYRSGMRWRFVPLSFFLGVVGWVIGGFAAVVDSTIGVNFIFHNTLWVPAHFHTYFLVGFFLILWGFIFELWNSAHDKLARSGLALVAVGGYGFIAMFYVGGAFGVPRRFANYSSIPFPWLVGLAENTAFLAVAFVALLVVGLLVMLAAIYGGAARSTPSTADPAVVP